MTFRECAAAFIEEHRPGWRNQKHIQQWANTLASYAFEQMGNKSVSQVTVEDVRLALQPIWLEKHETATRLRGRIESILDWARVRGLRFGDNPARWRGNLEYLMPKVPRVKLFRRHHPSLPHREIAECLAEVRAADGVSGRALEFLVLSAARTSEVTHATWAEVDLVELVWTVPAERMKSGRPHRVPLTPRMLELLKAQAQVSKPDGYIFQGMKERRPLSNMSMKMLLRRLGRGEITVHGFRSTFRDWAAECTDFDSRVAELALAHVDQNKVRKAYQRSDLLDLRRQLMLRWEQKCSDLLTRH